MYRQIDSINREKTNISTNVYTHLHSFQYLYYATLVCVDALMLNPHHLVRNQIQNIQAPSLDRRESIEIIKKKRGKFDCD